MTYEERETVPHVLHDRHSNDPNAELRKRNECFVCGHSPKARRIEAIDEGIGYMDCTFLTTTSDMVERLFSKTGCTLTDRRSCLTPEHFEQQMLLFVNTQRCGLTDINDILLMPL